jgi:hypothetical protein
MHYRSHQLVKTGKAFQLPEKLRYMLEYMLYFPCDIVDEFTDIAKDAAVVSIPVAFL